MTSLMPLRFTLVMLMAIIIGQLSFGQSTLSDELAGDSVDVSAIEDETSPEDLQITDPPTNESRLTDDDGHPADPESNRNVIDLIHPGIATDGLDELAPLRGDFDLDGILDVNKDLRMLKKQIDKSDPDMCYDLNQDGKVTIEDTRYWIERIRGISVGDANLDHRVDSGDFTSVFEAAKYRTGEPATWETGDFDGDGKFDNADMKFVELGGAYERPPRQSVASSRVREPIVLSLVGMGLVFLLLAYTAFQGQKQVLQQPPTESN
jgi:hypothetical protein